MIFFLRTSAAVSKYRGAENQFPLSNRGGTSLGSARSKARARGVFARLEKLEARRLGSTLRERTKILQSFIKNSEKSGKMVIFHAYFNIIFSLSIFVKCQARFFC